MSIINDEINPAKEGAAILEMSARACEAYTKTECESLIDATQAVKHLVKENTDADE